jgi:hypothetical protein
MLQELPPELDIPDYAYDNDPEALGPCEETLQAATFIAQPPPQRLKQRLYHDVDELPDEDVLYLVEEYIPAHGFTEIFGESNTYKTFCGTDIGGCVAAGIPWHGHAVDQGAVVYVCGEGLHTYRQRLAAWKMQNEVNYRIPFYTTSMPCHFLDQEQISELRALLFDINRECSIKLVIVDTLNRNFGDGDESSTPDITKFMNGLYSLLGDKVAYLIIHHTGHQNKERGRGAYALHAGLEADYRIERIEQTEHGTPGFTLNCTKMRSADYPPVMAFATQRVVVDPVKGRDSLAVVPIDTETAIKDQKTQKKDLSPQQQQIIARLQKYRSSQGGWPKFDNFIADIVADGVYGNSFQAKRSIESLVKRGFLYQDAYHFLQVRGYSDEP